jgi:hypothetical protein
MYRRMNPQAGGPPMTIYRGQKRTADKPAQPEPLQQEEK